MNTHLIALGFSLKNENNACHFYRVTFLMQPTRNRTVPQVSTHETDLSPLASTKALQRAAKFKKIGAAISALKPHYDDRDYHTGRASSFAFKRYDNHSRAEVVDSIGVQYCPWPKAECTIPFGPEFKTPQWERTVKE
jgi:hypothetical protein